jgi:purine nucleosidase/pyrimidine-specific ribonucleoside hydrolase
MSERLPLIIDTDPGIDDALALLLAAGSPELEVLAVTTVGGNVTLEHATENAQRILSIAWQGRPLPPLYRGSAGGSETAEYVHGADGLGGVSLHRDPAGELHYPPTAPLASGSAHEAILSLVRSRPDEVTLVTLGPLTNVAAALHRDPTTMRRVREVVIMGGAFREPGNTGPVAEFNIFVDPEAAQVVCDSGLPLRWVPVDVTHRCLLRREQVEQLPDSLRARFARAIAEFYMDYHHYGYGEYACFLHDPVAIAAVVWPELFHTELQRVDVELFGSHTRGMTVADFRPAAYRSFAQPNSAVTLGVDHETLVSRIVERLS